MIYSISSLPFLILLISLSAFLLPSLQGRNGIDVDVSVHNGGKVNVHVNVNGDDDNHYGHHGHHGHHAESESALSSSTAAVASLPLLPQVYHYISTYSSAAAGVVQPTEFWMDGINFMNRVDYFHGDDFTITRGDKNGTTYNVGYQNGKKVCLISQDTTQVVNNVTSGTLMNTKIITKLTLTSPNVNYKFIHGDKKGQSVLTNHWEYSYVNKDMSNRWQWRHYNWFVDPKTNLPVAIHSTVADDKSRDIILADYLFEFSLFEASLGNKKNIFAMPTLYGKCYDTKALSTVQLGDITHGGRANFSSSIDMSVYTLQREKLETEYNNYLLSQQKTADKDTTTHILRKNAFVDTLHQVQLHNRKYHKGESSYTMKITSNADALPAEKKSMARKGVNPSLLSSSSKTILGSKTLWGYQDKKQMKLTTSLIPKGFNRWEPQNLARVDLTPNLYVRYYEPTGKPLPEKIDWRTEIPGNNIVGPIHDQGTCGSCWAFSSSHVISTQWAKQYGHYEFFSPNELMECSWDFGNMGCIGGGDAIVAQAWAAANGGLYSQKDYANGEYKEQVGKCHKKEMLITHPHAVKAEVVGTEVIHTPVDILDALAFRGPVSVEMHWADPLESFGGGVFSVSNSTECPETIDDLTHAVLAIGFGKDEKTGKDYLLIWNQWGAFWGDSEDPSTMKLYFPRDGSVNTCGVTTAASIPVLKGSDQEKKLRKEWEDAQGHQGATPTPTPSPTPSSPKGKKGSKGSKAVHHDHA